MTSLNLVDGGLRPGWFQTRRSRLVHITESFLFSEPAQPGAELKSRTCWRGQLFMMDGHTPDTTGVWEESGAFQSRLSTLSNFDLILFVKADDPVAVPAKA